jgi:hypothetical protein
LFGGQPSCRSGNYSGREQGLGQDKSEPLGGNFRRDQFAVVLEDDRGRIARLHGDTGGVVDRGETIADLALAKAIR